MCENPSGEDWVPREGDISQNPEGGDEEGGGENPGEEARIRKLHRMKERRPSTQDYMHLKYIEYLRFTTFALRIIKKSKINYHKMHCQLSNLFSIE